MPAIDAGSLDGFVFDLDGCIYFDDRPAPGARTLVQSLRRAGKRVIFLTNGSIKTTEMVAASLRGMGIEAAEADVLSPIAYSGEYLARTYGVSRVFHLGSPITTAYLEQWGHELVRPEAKSADLVLVSCDPGVDYFKLNEAVRFLRAGAKLVGTNTDVLRPGRNGHVRLETGAILAALVACHAGPVDIIGKPSPFLFAKAVERLDTPAERLAMVGDTVSTDIVGGRAAGMKTILISESPPSAGAQDAPDLVYPNLIVMRRELYG